MPLRSSPIASSRSRTPAARSAASPQDAPTWVDRTALRVFQAGAVAVVLAASTYEPFELDRFFVPKELALHLTACLGALLALGTVRRWPFTRLDALLAAFLALSTLSTVLATNEWAGARALAITVSGVAVFWTARGLRGSGLAQALVAALALGVVLAAATSLLQAYGVRTGFFDTSRAPGGTLGNRNFVGHLAALGLPVVFLYTLRPERRRAFVLGAVGVALVAAALVLTRSRAAWLGAAASVGIMLVGCLFAAPVRRDGKLLLRFVLLLGVAGGGVAAAIVLPNQLRWRSDAPYLETARGVVNYREGSGRGRLHQYGRTLVLALRNPVFGVGPGNWPVAYPEVATRNDPSMNPHQGGMTMNPWPSSDWMAHLSERGLPAFALLVLVCLALARGAWRTMRSASDTTEGLSALALLATLAGTAVVGTFDAVTLLAWPTFFFWVAAGALSDPETLSPLPAGPSTRALALLVVAVLCGAAAVRSTGQLAAIALYTADETRDDLERAARLDPGNYRVHLRLAQRYRNRAQRCEHALAAHALFPHAHQAERLAARCE